MALDRFVAVLRAARTPRYRVAVVAHRRGDGLRRAVSGIAHAEVVREHDPAFALDLVLLRVHIASALVCDSPVRVDAVAVDRLRRGRAPVRVDLRRPRRLVTRPW